jgi:hypothetical protein
MIMNLTRETFILYVVFANTHIIFSGTKFTLEH